jgi:hypothetical protein
VTFRDGAVVVGTVPVDGSGNASLPVTFSSAGSHTVVAVYSGDGSYGVGSATTSVEVTPAPVGYAVGGSVTVGASCRWPGVAVGAGFAAGGGGVRRGHVRMRWRRRSGVVVHATTVTVDAPGYGSVQAEVRLVQYGR